jgi:hypothetical protein
MAPPLKATMKLICGYGEDRIANRERPIRSHPKRNAVWRPGRTPDGEESMVERAACEDAGNKD